MKLLGIASLSVLAIALCLCLLFLPAGRLSWVRGWLFLGLLLVPSLVLLVVLRRRNPELLRRRMQVGKGTRGWDRVLVQALKLGFTAVMVVAAFDAGPVDRPSLAFAWWFPAAALFLAGYALFIRAMLANTHFESHVRIQHDRAHAVVDAGPYRRVRHPGYAGFGLQILATPFLLGSTLALVPALLTFAVLVLRTALEDRLLRQELSGYAEYAARVRWRLLPRVW